MKEKKNTNWFLVILALISISVLFSLLHLESTQMQNKTELEKEIDALQQEKEELLSSSKQLIGRISYINTPEYKEEVVRTQVGMKRDGELVYSFSEEEEKTVTVDNKVEKQTPLGNARLWLEYFFPKER